MNIIEKQLNEIKPYEKNPRKNSKAVDKVANSIREFGFKVPIVIDANGTIVAGHTRYLAALKLGLETVPCIEATDLTDQQIKAFRLADNKTSEFSEWDFDLLGEELNSLLDFDMSDFGFDDDEGQEEKNPYTLKVGVPQYTPKGDEPEIIELFDDSKTMELIEEIENSDISDEKKEFLKLAAYRHCAFNYKNIAEFYCHQDKEMQELMEKSALVIIDFDDAMRYGFVKLSKKLEGLIGIDG